MIERLFTTYETLEKLPFGKWVFSRLAGHFVPYSGSIHANVQMLKKGHAEVTLRDRKSVRNHLSSVHAMALANLGELTSGLAFLSSVPTGTKAIVTHFSTDYLKKAKGTLRATSHCLLVGSNERSEHRVVAEIFNAAGEIVAKTEATWLIAPK